MSNTELNKYSKTLTQDPTQPATQAQYYGIGFTEEDFSKAQVGIASMGYDGNTCNMHLNDLAEIVKDGVKKENLVGLMFHTIGISDGMTNGTDGMRYSLVSRDIIADSIEAVCAGQYYDGVITVPGCDKNMPACIMGMATATGAAPALTMRTLPSASVISSSDTFDSDTRSIKVLSFRRSMGLDSSSFGAYPRRWVRSSAALSGPGCQAASNGWGFAGNFWQQRSKSVDCGTRVGADVTIPPSSVDCRFLGAILCDGVSLLPVCTQMRVFAPDERQPARERADGPGARPQACATQPASSA